MPCVCLLLVGCGLIADVGAHTLPVARGGFWPSSLPLFQGTACPSVGSGIHEWLLC